jgi:hypothetical protein
MQASFFRLFSKRVIRGFWSFLIAGLLLSGCSAGKGKKLARVGNATLYETDLSGSTTGTSDTMLQNVKVRSWVLGQLLYGKAKDELNRQELDKSKELQDYYRQLLRYEYEKKFLEGRTKSEVADSAIRKYYQENKSNFEGISFDSVKSLIEGILVYRNESQLVKQLENRLWQEALDKKEMEIY